MKISNLSLSLFVATLLLTLSLNVVQAHAFLEKASPGVGSQVSPAPCEVKIWYTEGAEPAFSSIQVVDATGKRVDKNDTKVDDKDKTVLHVSLAPLSSGTYKVSWKVVSEDTHHTQGSFSFTVR